MLGDQRMVSLTLVECPCLGPKLSGKCPACKRPRNKGKSVGVRRNAPHQRPFLSPRTSEGRTFILSGFTDAKGSETYNQGLSERRADAVKQFLSEKYGIEAGNLVTVGYGQSQLKDSANPFAAENRRVQVTNAADK